MPNSTTFGQNGTTDKDGPQAPGQVPTSNGIDGVQGVTPVDPTPTVAAPDAEVSQGAGPQAQGVGTGFVNLQSLLMANRAGAQSQAQGLVNTAYAQGNAAKQSGSLEDAKKASNTANGLNTFGGLQSQLQDKFKGNAYNGGASAFDTLITGAAGQQAFSQAQQAYGTLYNSLVTTPSPAPTSAPAPAPLSQAYSPDSSPMAKAKARIYDAKHNPRGRTSDDNLDLP